MKELILPIAIALLLLSIAIIGCDSDEGVTEPSATGGNWTGIYGSGRYGLSFVVDNDGFVRDFTITAHIDNNCGEILTEVTFDGPDTIGVDGSFAFSATWSETPNAITEKMSGVFASDSEASGTFDESFLMIGNGSMCIGGTPGVHWNAARDCSVVPEEGVSATRFCP